VWIVLAHELARAALDSFMTDPLSSHR